MPRRFDFSKKHILSAVDGSLQRLGTEYLDILLRHFGVSNMSAAQIRFLRSAVQDPFIVNQLEMSLAHLNWLDQGIYVNQREGTKSNFSEGLMEYCQMENIQIQAWGPLAQGRFSGRSLDNESESVKAAAERIAAMAREKETTPEAIVLGWLMRHPAMIQPVIGTASVNRIKACEDAARQAQLMTKIEWNELYAKASGII